MRRAVGWVGVVVVGLAVGLACGASNDEPARAPDSSIASIAAGAGASAPARPQSAQPQKIEMWPVSGGTQGMRATVRWALSPDRRSIVVVEDPVSVEAEALPDGFLYASERTGGVVQIDNVWDVAPSPDWTRLAFGRAYILRGGERDTVPPAEWHRLEARLPEDVTDRDAAALRRRLEAHAFPASGMSLMLGLGVTQVMWVDNLPPGRVGAPAAATHSLHGWRVRWAQGGDTLAVGASPKLVQDDAPPVRWVLVRPRRGATYTDTLGATTDTTRFATVQWIDGPTMELGSPVDLRLGRDLTVSGGRIATRDGQIGLRMRVASGEMETRIVGPGIPLAATATGRFIVALVPRTSAKESEMPARPVVYHIP